MKLQTSVQIKTEAADGACKNQQHRVHWGTAGPVDEAGRRGQTGPAHSPDDNSSVRGVMLGSSLRQESGARQSVSRSGASREGSVQQKQPSIRASPGAPLGYLPPDGQLGMGLREPMARMQQQTQEQQQQQQQGAEDQAGPSSAPSSHRLSDPPEAQAVQPQGQQGASPDISAGIPASGAAADTQADAASDPAPLGPNLQPPPAAQLPAFRVHSRKQLNPRQVAPAPPRQAEAEVFELLSDSEDDIGTGGAGDAGGKQRSGGSGPSGDGGGPSSGGVVAAGVPQLDGALERGAAAAAKEAIRAQAVEESAEELHQGQQENQAQQARRGKGSGGRRKSTRAGVLPVCEGEVGAHPGAGTGGAAGGAAASNERHKVKLKGRVLWLSSKAVQQCFGQQTYLREEADVTLCVRAAEAGAAHGPSVAAPRLSSRRYYVTLRTCGAGWYLGANPMGERLSLHELIQDLGIKSGGWLSRLPNDECRKLFEPFEGEGRQRGSVGSGRGEDEAQGLRDQGQGGVAEGTGAGNAAERGMDAGEPAGAHAEQQPSGSGGGSGPEEQLLQQLEQPQLEQQPQQHRLEREEMVSPPHKQRRLGGADAEAGEAEEGAEGAGQEQGALGQQPKQLCFQDAPAGARDERPALGAGGAEGGPGAGPVPMSQDAPAAAPAVAPAAGTGGAGLGAGAQLQGGLQLPPAAPPQAPPQAPGSPSAPATTFLPGTSLTAAHLCGAVPPYVGPPPQQPGELPLCSLTHHPEQAPRVRQAMADWEARLGGTPLRLVHPARRQVQAMLEAHLAALRPGVIASAVCWLLGLYNKWDAELPKIAPELVGVEKRHNPSARGGWVLAATRTMQPSFVLGIVGGYVMPRAAAGRFARSDACSAGGPEGVLSNGVVEEMRRRCGEYAACGWELLTAWHSMPYPAAAPGGGAAGGEQGEGSAGLSDAVMTQLGYGNLAALVADPWVFEAAEGGMQEQRREANCVVVPVSVRGLVLPVLVALRPVAIGDEMVMDRGAAWREGVADSWEHVVDFAGVDGCLLLHGPAAGQQG